MAAVNDQGLNEDQAAKVFDTMNLAVLERELPFLQAVNENSEYQGFNPREIIKILIDHHDHLQQDILTSPDLLEKFEAEVKGTDVPAFVFSNNMSFAHDMQFICLMFVIRSAAFDKIFFVKKGTETMAKCMKLMKVKYNINAPIRNPGTSLDSRIITVPRIAASFPAITVGLFHKGFGRLLFDPSSIFGDIILPRALFSPMIPSVLPKTGENVLSILLLIAIKTDDILHQTGAKTTTLQALMQYLMASYNSTAVTELEKIEYCMEWGLIVRDARTLVPHYTEVIISAVAVAKDKIRALRGNDPSIETIIAQM